MNRTPKSTTSRVVEFMVILTLAGLVAYFTFEWFSNQMLVR